MMAYMTEHMCQTLYIVKERLAFNVIFPPVSDVEGYGCSLEVTINCSKPELKPGEQRPKNVLAPGATTPISAENVGFKPGLRAWGCQVRGRDFFVHPPPYPYCGEHVVLIERAQVPMKIDRGTIADVAAAAALLPGMYICSNTDLSGTGASILQQRHYQLVSKRFPIMDAKSLLTIQEPNATVEYLSFPCAAARITSSSADAAVSVAARLLDSWRSSAVAEAVGTKVETHTASLLCYTAGPDDAASSSNLFELIIIPRTSSRMTRTVLHCIKSEFVGVLEMAGFGILPGRLKTELADLLLNGKRVDEYAEWVEQFDVAIVGHGSATGSTGSSSASNDGVDLAIYSQERGRTLRGIRDADAVTAANAISAAPLLTGSSKVNAALYSAFLAIIEDNSAFRSSDLDKANAWFAGAGLASSAV